MALWLVRTGRHGEHERQFTENDRIYLTWPGLKRDLARLKDRRDFLTVQHETYPEQPQKAVIHYSAQMQMFVQKMKIGDWAIVPGKNKAIINVAEITGDYEYDPAAPSPYNHSRTVKWVGREIPRTNFTQDLLYSFNAFSTICQIRRNQAENRVRSMAANAWKEGKTKLPTVGPVDVDEEGEGHEESADLEETARDQIARHIMARFKGHGLAHLVEAILKAQGYITHLSPPGPDKGVDILAAPAPLGFGRPRICVQVKSSDSPVDSPTLHQLIGSMQNVGADQGLLVSWGGFKSSVDREIPAQFFRVRLWDQETLIAELLAHYDKLDADLRAELPLKRIWTLALQDETE